MVTAPLRVVFFGTPAFAVPTLRKLIGSSHEVALVVSQPDRPRGRGHHQTATPTRLLADASGIPVAQPERLRDEAFLGRIGQLAPDLGVVAAYGKLLPAALLRLPRLGMINVHASLLPKWRGAAPVHRAVIAGEAETGVTIMKIVEELDAGPMLAMVHHPIGPDDTSPQVESALARIGAELLVEVVDRMARDTGMATEQDHAAATYAPKIMREEGRIEWSQPAPVIHNLVRGLQPWPLVSGRIAGGRVLLHATTVLADASTEPAGTIVAASGDRLDVAAGDRRLLRILRLQPEGKRVMTAREFLAGRRVAPGTRIERG